MDLEDQRRATLLQHAAEQAAQVKAALEVRWDELAAPMRAQLEEQARQEIEARPMGKRLLEGPIGVETLRKRCLEFVAGGAQENLEARAR